MSLAADLFAEDEWRVLLWETTLRLEGNADFPADEEDMAFLAYAGETALRHWKWRIRERLKPIAEEALNHPVFANGSMRREQELIRSFLHECSNPLYAVEIEPGQWAASARDPSGSEIERLTENECLPAHQILLLALARLARVPVAWTRRRSSQAGLSDVIGFANYDLVRADLPLVEVDTVGGLYVLVKSPEQRRRVDTIISHHGFEFLRD
jgi:hypothetical protein